MTLQEELFNAVKNKFPLAEAKKINVDNYLDIHIPNLNKKRGTHLWCNTAKNEIKIGFYCRDIEFTDDVLGRSTKIEKYSQGFRELGYPAHLSVEKAIESIWEFTNQITSTQGSSSTPIEPIKVESEPILMEVQNNNAENETATSVDPINEFKKELEAYKNKDFAKTAEYVNNGNLPLEFHNKILIEDYLLTLVIGGNLSQEKLQYLVSQNYNLDVRNNENDLLTGCHFASDSNQFGVLEMLIAAGANPDLGDQNGNTPLHLAVKNKDIKCVKLLIDKKVDLDKKVIADDIITEGKTGTTALRYAVLKQLWDISDLLIQAGANLVNLKDPCLNGENFFDALKKYQNEHPNFSEQKINDLISKINSITSISLNSAFNNATDLKTLVTAFNDKLINEDLDQWMMDELDALTGPSSLLLYKISIENLQKAFDTEIITNDDFELVKILDLGDWDGLIENIGVSEVTKNKEEYSSETIYSNGCIVFLYCEGEYIYSFMSSGDEGEDNDNDNEEVEESEYKIPKTKIEAGKEFSDSIVKEISIGKQVWTTENLNVEKFQNGDLIPFVETDEQWHEAGENEQPAWCYYDNDPSNGKKYGKLYNWYAIIDPRGLAPEGWHIPSDKEWTIL